MADSKTLKMAEFYEQCQQNGYTDMKDEKQSLKAKVIATDLGLKYGKITDFYAKAEKAYMQVNEEKERERQQQEERRKQRRELAAKRAVDGELLVTMSDSQSSSENGTVLRVFLRPDKSVYTTVDNGCKIEGAPTIEAKESGVIKSTYHPSQLVYTGATVGRVTTGGFHQTQESISSHLNKTGTGFLQATIGEQRIFLFRITMSEKTRGIFKRDAAFRRLTDSNGGIAGYNTAPSNWASIYSQGALYAKDIGMQMSMLSAAADEKSLSFARCAEIADLLTRVVSAHFPPSDSELYEKACALEKSGSLSDLKSAMEIFNQIAGYKDSSKRERDIRPKYEELLQEEKERKILEAEATAKKNRLALAIIIPVAIAFIAFLIVLETRIIPENNYKEAVALYENGQYSNAIDILESLGEYKDSKEIVEAAKKEKKAEEYAALEAKKAEEYAKAEAKNEEAYAEAVALLETAQYDKAIAAFIALGEYKDSPEKVLAAKYAKAEELLSEEKIYFAAQEFYKAKDYKDAWTRCQTTWGKLTHREALSAGEFHTVGLKSDGSVVATGENKYGQCDVNSWRNIIAVSVGRGHTVGLKTDGTLVATGENNDGQCNVSGWRDIVAVSAGAYHTVGLKADGSVVAVGNSGGGRCDVGDWSDIIAISAGGSYTLGLKTDGSVVAVGNFPGKRSDINSWDNVTAISPGAWHFVGLKEDGRIVAICDNRYGNSQGQCDVSSWRNIVAVSAGGDHTVGLMSDGSVVAIGENNYGQCNVTGWSNIVAVAAGKFHTVGLKADGRVVAIGSNRSGQCNVSDWKDIKLPD